MKKRLTPDFELAFDNTAESAGFLLWKLSNIWQRKMRESLEKAGITHVQFLLLQTMARLNAQQAGAITQVRLATESDCDKMMVSKVLRTLEERKLVERHAHHSDTRSRSLFITSKGMETLKAAVPHFNATEQAFFESLGKKEKSFRKRLLKLDKQHQSDPAGDEGEA